MRGTLSGPPAFPTIAQKGQDSSPAAGVHAGLERKCMKDRKRDVNVPRKAA
jgi:hypothetical protein